MIATHHSPTRYLVTGGSGFIGSNFIHHLFHSRAGAPWVDCCPDHAWFDTLGDQPDLEILNVDYLTYAGEPKNLDGVDHLPGYRFMRADICDRPTIDVAIRDFSPDVIVHFAAESHVDRSIESGDAFVQTNVVGTQVLLDAARRHAVSRFVHISTDEVYGSVSTGSFAESSSLDPSSPYSASKAASDLLALAHHRTYGLPVSVTRCTNNFGPRQHREKLVPKVIGNALAHQKIPIYGTGRNVRDWLYVKDHCAAIERVLTLSDSGSIWNIGADQEFTNIEIVSKILEQTGRSDELVTYVKDRPGHDFRYSLDSTKLRAQGWSPALDFDAAVGLTIEWYGGRRHE